MIRNCEQSFTFLGYCRSVGVGYTTEAVRARMIVKLEALRTTPSGYRKFILRQAVLGRIGVGKTKELMETVDRLAKKWREW